MKPVLLEGGETSAQPRASKVFASIAASNGSRSPAAATGNEDV